MPSYVTPKKNAAYIIYVSLVSQADTKIMHVNPTLAAGDVKVAIDDGAPANLATLPAVDADFTKRVKVSLSAAEMNGDNITVIFSDAAGAEWCDLTINIQTTASQIDDLALAATALTDVTWTDAKAGYLDGAISGRAPANEYDTEMARITGNVALASVVGALNNVAADGDPTDADTLVQYIKQLINVLVGTAGIVAFPTEQAPANAINLAEVIRAIHADVTGLNGSAMVGTNGANTVVPDAAGVAPTAIEIRQEIDSNSTRLDADMSSRATPANVNTEVSDVLKTDVISEQAQGIPPTTPTFEKAIMYLYMALTKKIDVDASLKEFYNDAGAVVWKKAVADDGTNYNEDKGQSGP